MGTSANYGEWDFLYANALLESDGTAKRANHCCGSSDQRTSQGVGQLSNNPETAALIDALRALHSVQARRNRAANPITYGTES